MKKKREQKILKQFIRQLKKIAKEMTFDYSVKPCPSEEQMCEMMTSLLKHTKRDVPLMMKTDDKTIIGVNVAKGHDNIYECTVKCIDKQGDMPVQLKLIKSRNLTGDMNPIMPVPDEWQHNSADYNPYKSTEE